MMNQIIRPYSEDDVRRLQGKTRIEHTLAKRGAGRLRNLFNTQPYVAALGAQTGNQAVQMAKAGLRAIYASGWQVAADANTAGQTYPDMSLYPVDSMPTLVKRINNALLRAEQIDHVEGRDDTEWMVPIIADAEAGFGGTANVFELTKALIEAGASGIHYEDQNSSVKRCGHLAGKVLIPTSQHIQSLIAARLASDVLGVNTVIIARTDAESAQLVTSDIDERDRPFITQGDRTSEGFYRLSGDPMDRCITRALAYAPYADMLWFETSTPNLLQAKRFADAIHEKFPEKQLAYNCSPSFNWVSKLTSDEIANFQVELSKLSYKFLFVTLAGFHSIAQGMFDLAFDYRQRGMTAYVELQTKEFQMESIGYTAVKHQREASTGYFDAVAQVISGGSSSTLALNGSTETQQFTEQADVSMVPSDHVRS